MIGSYLLEFLPGYKYNINILFWIKSGKRGALYEEKRKQINETVYPILTGQDCDINSVKNILNGKQSMSVFKDTRVLADKVVEMTKAIINGEEVPVNDTETYDNGTGVVPSYLCEPVYADKNNYKEILLDSGYYKEDQLK